MHTHSKIKEKKIVINPQIKLEHNLILFKGLAIIKWNLLEAKKKTRKLSISIAIAQNNKKRNKIVKPNAKASRKESTNQFGKKKI